MKDQPQEEKTEPMKCGQCGKPYEPDQYYAWCNPCGKKIEDKHFYYLNSMSKEERKNQQKLKAITTSSVLKEEKTEWYCKSCKETVEANGEHLCKEKTEGWEKRFEEKFMYDRGSYLEFDLMKAGNVGELIDFIHQLLQQEREKAYQEGINWNNPEILKAKLNEAREKAIGECVEVVEKMGIIPDFSLLEKLDKGLQENIDAFQEASEKHGYNQALKDINQKIQSLLEKKI